jgi:hypothetical protein
VAGLDEFGAGAVELGKGPGELGFSELGPCPQPLACLAELVAFADRVVADQVGLTLGRLAGAVEFSHSGLSGLLGTGGFLLGSV